jgi:hypothetical protein
MIAAVLTIIIALSCVSYLYLKSSTPRSFASVIVVVIAVIAALGYYEIASDFLISRGRGGQWAQPVVFLVIFIGVVVGAQSLADYLLHKDVEFGPLYAKITAVVCGIIAGLIITGALFIALAMSPLAPKWPYARFDETNLVINSPTKPLLNSDGFVAALFGWISKGSLSSAKSFAFYHPDFIDQLHLNHYKASEGVYTIAAADSVVVPNKYGVRIMNFDDQAYIVVRMGVKSGEISTGGAMDKNGQVSFTFSQVRLVCKEKAQAAETTGSAQVVYPEAQIVQNQLIPMSPDETFTFGRGEFARLSPYGMVAWVDLAFRVPSNLSPVLIEFKNNALAPLPKAIVATAEINRELDRGEPESGGGRGRGRQEEYEDEEYEDKEEYEEY